MKVSRPFRMPQSSRGTLRWGIAVQPAGLNPYGLVIYFLPKERKWRSSYSQKISDEVQRGKGLTDPVTPMLFETTIDVPDPSRPAALTFMVSLLSERDRADAMAAAIREAKK